MFTTYQQFIVINYKNNDTWNSRKKTFLVLRGRFAPLYPNIIVNLITIVIVVTNSCYITTITFIFNTAVIVNHKFYYCCYSYYYHYSRCYCWKLLSLLLLLFFLYFALSVVTIIIQLHTWRNVHRSTESVISLHFSPYGLYMGMKLECFIYQGSVWTSVR